MLLFNISNSLHIIRNKGETGYKSNEIALFLKRKERKQLVGM